MSPSLLNTPALDICGLTKHFGRLAALDGLDASIARGRVTAIVGPNGSGKSTLIKCILGLVRADTGRIAIDGTSIDDSPDYRHTIGYMPQRAPFPENLTGEEILSLVRSVRGSRATIDFELIDRFRLGVELRKPIRALSGGTRQKLNAVVAYPFRPSLVILDEPTAGLDPVANSVLKQKVVDAAGQGVTHLLASHVLSEVEELANEVVFLLDGRAHFRGSLASLCLETGENRLERAVARLMQGGAR